MAYMDYDFQNYEKVADVASEFNTTVDEIMRVNNVTPPYPTYIRDLPKDVIRGGTIKMPYVTNGRQTFENYYNTAANTLGVEYKNAETYEEETLRNYTARYYSRKDFDGNIDIRPGKFWPQCFITIDGVQWHFPCYPESVSDSNTANYSSVSILGRSEPFQYYNNSGPRTVSAKFRMHVDMVDSQRDPNSDYIYRLAAAIESTCYPNYGNGVAMSPVTFQVANNIRITGIISSVSTSYDGPLLDMMDGPNRGTESDMLIPKYAIVDIDFSITEVSGNCWSRTDIGGQVGRGGLGGWR